MKDKKHIDRLFQEKLKNFEATPDDMVWDKVHTTLHGEKDDVKPIPLFWKIAGVAAILLILITAGNFLFNNDSKRNDLPVVDNTEINSNQEPITDSEQRNNDEAADSQESELVNNEKSHDQIDLKVKEQNNNSDNTSVITRTSKENKSNYTTESNLAESNKSNAKTNNLKDPSTDHKAISNLENKNEAIDDVDATKKSLARLKDIGVTEEVSVSSEDKKNIQNKDVEELTKVPTDVTGAITDNTVESIEKKDSESTDTEIASLDELNEKEKEEVEKLNRWNIYPNVSPVYFNTMGNGSSIDSQFNQNSKSGEINFSYGINGSYAINDKLKIRAGINKVDLGYKTNDVIVYRNSDAVVNDNARLRNIRFKDSERNTSFLSATNLSYALIPDVIANNIKGSLDQELGFIEVPLEVEYSILKSRVGINVIGGFSAFFLNKNEVYSTLQGDRRLIGEATNINNTSYSANFGVGFNFKFTETIDINLEPTFKYQLNTFSDSSGNFQPYVIGLYSGLRFKF